MHLVTVTCHASQEKRRTSPALWNMRPISKLSANRVVYDIRSSKLGENACIVFRDTVDVARVNIRPPESPKIHGWR